MKHVPSTWTSYTLLAGRIIVGGIFLLAGLAKVQSTNEFASTVRAYHLLAPSLVAPFAMVLPWLELLAAVYLVVGFLTRVAAVAAGGMLIMFIVALGDALVTGNTAHACGCFGGGLGANPVVAALAGGNSIGWWDVIRDVLLLAVCALIAWFGSGVFAVDSLIARGRKEHDEPTLPRKKQVATRPRG